MSYNGTGRQAVPISALMIVTTMAIAYGFLVGFATGRAAERVAALRAGAARWVVSPQSGEARLEYVKAVAEEVR